MSRLVKRELRGLSKYERESDKGISADTARCPRKIGVNSRQGLESLGREKEQQLASAATNVENRRVEGDIADLQPAMILLLSEETGEYEAERIATAEYISPWFLARGKRSPSVICWV